MNIPKITAKNVLFFIIFTALVLIGSQINFSRVTGAENQYFTLFQFFGPIAGGFLGSIIGVASVLFAEILNFFYVGNPLTLLGAARLLPMLFAAYYFASKSKRFSTVIPLVCMAAFIIHPIGRQVWYYSLFWLVPIAAKFFPERLFLRSLGSTFTAHAIGSAIWIWLIPMPAVAWIALIPVTFVERTLFAAGISISFVVFNTVLDKLEAVVPTDFITIEKQYVLSKEFLKARILSRF